MTLNLRFDSLVKAAVISLSAVALLSACGNSSANSTNGAADGRSTFEVAGDHGMGDANAPITVVEYASVTCGHCANWNLTVWPEFREKYVDTGKVRYVFREFPTPPVDLARAGHLLANCAAEDKYFDMIHIMFKKQRQIFGAQDIRSEFLRLAKSANMSEAEFDTCMTNKEELTRLQAVENGGLDAGVTGTPTFYVNGEKKQNIFKMEDFDKIFANILGEPVPETSDKPKDTGH